MLDKKFVLPKRKTMHESVVSVIRDAILNGEFKSGERLPQEDLAKALEVSRMPVREALRQLEKEGLVKIEPHKGAIAKPVTVEDIKEIYELRVMIEVKAIEKSMNKLSEEELEYLVQLNNKMQEAYDDENQDDFVYYNTKFHRILIEASKGKRIIMIHEMLWNSLPPHTPFVLQDQMCQSIKEHDEILQSLKNKNVKNMKKTVKNHIIRTRDQLIKHFKKIN